MPKIDLKINKKVFVEKYYPLLWNYNHRHEVYYGGAGSGKSIFVFQKVILKALSMKRKILVVRKYAKSNLNSTWALTLDILSKWKLLDLCNVNNSIQQITFPNTSKIIFVGCDDPEKLKSIAAITDVVCEECSELTLDDVTQLDLRLRARDGKIQMFYMFNPVSKQNWTYKRWFADGVEIPENTIITKSTYLDNPFLPQSYIDSLLEMKKTNPTYYRIYALGEFASLDKLVYNNWNVTIFDHSSLDGELCIGLDFGFVNDTTALVASVVNQQEKTIHIFKEWGAKGKTNDEIAEAIKALGFSKSTIIADAAEPKSVEEIKRLGISKIKPCSKGKDSILHGIQQLQQYQIFVHPSCTETITEFQNYAWKKDKSTGEYINSPIDECNHYLDALRYSLQVMKTKLKTLDKNLL